MTTRSNQISTIITDEPSLITQKSEIHGRGLFAKNLIENFALICEGSVEAAKKNSAVVLDGPLRWVNHSVNPNAVLSPNFDIKTGILVFKLIAIRDI